MPSLKLYYTEKQVYDLLDSTNYLVVRHMRPELEGVEVAGNPAILQYGGKYWYNREAVRSYVEAHPRKAARYRDANNVLIKDVKELVFRFHAKRRALADDYYDVSTEEWAAANDLNSIFPYSRQWLSETVRKGDVATQEVSGFTVYNKDDIRHFLLRAERLRKVERDDLVETMDGDTYEDVDEWVEAVKTW